MNEQQFTDLPDWQQFTDLPDWQQFTDLPDWQQFTDLPDWQKFTDLPDWQKFTDLPDWQQFTDLPDWQQFTDLPDWQQFTDLPDWQKFTDLPDWKQFFPCRSHECLVAAAAAPLYLHYKEHIICWMDRSNGIQCPEGEIAAKINDAPFPTKAVTVVRKHANTFTQAGNGLVHVQNTKQKFPLSYCSTETESSITNQSTIYHFPVDAQRAKNQITMSRAPSPAPDLIGATNSSSYIHGSIASQVLLSPPNQMENFDFNVSSLVPLPNMEKTLPILDNIDDDLYSPLVKSTSVPQPAAELEPSFNCTVSTFTTIPDTIISGSNIGMSNSATRNNKRLVCSDELLQDPISISLSSHQIKWMQY